MRMPNIAIEDASILITGAAGFIGASLAKELLRSVPSVQVVGLDNLNDYYDPALKECRLAEIQHAARQNPQSEWQFVRADLAEPGVLDELCSKNDFDVVVHLAAQPGIRRSIEDPEQYVQSNLVGFFRMLEACRIWQPKHLVYASSSSVYGANCKPLLAVGDETNAPLNLYAATKKSDELMAYAYANLYQIPMTGLRFFTVYGPAGRPDMAYYAFADRLCEGERLQLFDCGKGERDYTYVDDAVKCIMLAMARASEGEPPYALYNVGGHAPVRLEAFVALLHEELLKAGLLPEGMDLESCVELLPAQPGDMHSTCADTTALERDFGFVPSTPLDEGLRRFVEWYREHRARA